VKFKIIILYTDLHSVYVYKYPAYMCNETCIDTLFFVLFTCVYFCEGFWVTLELNIVY